MLIRVVLVASVLLSMPRAGLASCEDAVVALAGGDMQYGLPEGAHALEVECSTRFVRVRESEDEGGLWLSEIERRLAAAR